MCLRIILALLRISSMDGLVLTATMGYWDVKMEYWDDVILG